jgi:hypothetical protein
MTKGTFLLRESITPACYTQPIQILVCHRKLSNIYGGVIKNKQGFVVLEILKCNN